MTHNPSASSAWRSCFRCGNQFQTCERERLCSSCRKPKDAQSPEAKTELTFRERQTVRLVAKGKTNKEIAHSLLLTEGTIKEYLNRLFRKAAVSNRTELAIWALTQSRFTEESRYESPAFEEASLMA